MRLSAWTRGLVVGLAAGVILGCGGTISVLLALRVL
jgi:hypothetical protein